MGEAKEVSLQIGKCIFSFSQTHRREKKMPKNIWVDINQEEFLIYWLGRFSRTGSIDFSSLFSFSRIFFHRRKGEKENKWSSSLARVLPPSPLSQGLGMVGELCEKCRRRWGKEFLLCFVSSDFHYRGSKIILLAETRETTITPSGFRPPSLPPLSFFSSSSTVDIIQSLKSDADVKLQNKNILLVFLASNLYTRGEMIPGYQWRTWIAAKQTRIVLERKNRIDNIP